MCFGLVSPRGFSSKNPEANFSNFLVRLRITLLYRRFTVYIGVTALHTPTY